MKNIVFNGNVCYYEITKVILDDLTTQIGIESTIFHSVLFLVQNFLNDIILTF
jgi:hypothetical protein